MSKFADTPKYTDEQKLQMMNKLISLERIRMLGGAFGNKETMQHMGVDMWKEFPFKNKEEFDEHDNRETLFEFLLTE